jgi:3-methyladenine DNA glycosylase/8-oxoguanine DNA glycosylase
MAPSGSPPSPDGRCELEAPYRVDLGAVLGPFVRGSRDPAALMEADGSAWRTARTPDGIGTLRLRSEGSRVDCRAWGPGAAWLLGTVPSLLGFQDDPDGFPAAELPRSLAAGWRRYADRWRVPRSLRVVEAMVIAVLEQKVTGVQSWRAWSALLEQTGDVAPGPVPRPMRVFPEPDRLRRVASWQWHRWGVAPSQSATILRVVGAANRLDQCADLPLVDARRRMGSLDGIGPWTVAETSQRALGDPDAVSFGDFHLAGAVEFAFTGRMAGTDERMAELLEPFAGHRYRVQRLVELAGITRPARGPRMTIADHRRH